MEKFLTWITGLFSQNNYQTLTRHVKKDLAMTRKLHDIFENIMTNRLNC